ncbi:MAG: hypothetical protein IIY70_01430, partial [Oscillospiraceae bacterium]|nr:hypothetical protein [Oscillospiraceae bacterium]
MKSEDLYNAVTDLEDQKILEGEKPLRPARSARLRWLGGIAALLTLVLLSSLVLPGLLREKNELPAESSGNLNAGDFSLAAAVYPKLAPMPDYYKRNLLQELLGEYEENPNYDAEYEAWEKDQEAFRPGRDYAEGFDPCFQGMLPGLLQGAGDQNRVVSPLNLYLALAMLTETTAGDSQQELLELLKTTDLQTLRSRANALWRGCYHDEDFTLLPGASLWLRDDSQYNQELVNLLASNYYGSVFSGPMGTERYETAMQSWMNEQTRSLLSEQIQMISQPADSMMELITTLYYKAAWLDPLSDPESGVFHAVTGDENCSFMYNGFNIFYTGEHFSAASIGMDGGGAMYFLLPDEGSTPESLMEQEDVLAFLSGSAGREQTPSRWVEGSLKLPQFDVNSETRLKEFLPKLGVEAVLDPDRADFSPLCAEATGVFLEDGLHDVRV